MPPYQHIYWWRVVHHFSFYPILAECKPCERKLKEHLLLFIVICLGLSASLIKRAKLTFTCFSNLIIPCCWEVFPPSIFKNLAKAFSLQFFSSGLHRWSNLFQFIAIFAALGTLIGSLFLARTTASAPVIFWNSLFRVRKMCYLYVFGILFIVIMQTKGSSGTEIVYVLDVCFWIQFSTRNLFNRKTKRRDWN